jgi:hypothetical protein
VYLVASVCEVEPEMLGGVVPGSIGVAYCTYKPTHKFTYDVILRRVRITISTLEDQ